MANSVYQINKGVNRSIEFRGLKAQYIWWLGGGLLILLILFAALYFIGINSFICLGLILVLGTLLFVGVARMSNKYGEHGMMKQMAARRVPRLITIHSRNIFRWKEH